MARRVLLLLVLGLAGGAEVADACSCMPVGPPCQEYWETPVIFRGRVESIERVGSSANMFAPREVSFTVLEQLRGTTSGTSVAVRTAADGASCGYRFAVGREYVVYAHQTDQGLSTNICTRTRPVDRAADDLIFARAIAAGERPGGFISGRVMRRTTDLATSRSRSDPMKGVAVSLLRDDAVLSASTDADGQFSIGGLDAGSYVPSVDVPRGFQLEVLLPQKLVLPDARACGTVDVVLVPDGRIRGRVVDQSGKPIRGLTLDLSVERAFADEPVRVERLRALTRRDGTYEFAGVPPGRFVVAVDFRTAAGQAGTRVFHPGVATLRAARRIVLAAGGEVALPDFVLPSDASVIELTGFVLDGDRAPIEGAKVYLRGPDERDVIVSLPAVTDWNGGFVISAPAGPDYLLFAERPRPGAVRSRVDSSQPIRIRPGAGGHPLILTLRSRY